MQEGREELVAGRWRPSLDVAKMYNMLKDGKPHTVSAIAEVVKPKSEANIGRGKFETIRRWGRESGQYDVVKVEDGSIQMVFPMHAVAQLREDMKQLGKRVAQLERGQAKPSQAKSMQPQRDSLIPIGKSSSALGVRRAAC